MSCRSYCGNTVLPIGWVCEVQITPCTFYIESFTGETNPVTQPFKSISIQKSGCCDLTVTLDGQSFVVPSYTNSQVLQFDCEITELTLEGDCLDETTVTVMNCIPESSETICTYVAPEQNGPTPGELARFPCRYNNCP